MNEYELTDKEWSAIEPMLPHKSRGVPRVDDRRVLSGIFFILRSGTPWRNLPKEYGPYTTCYNRYVRWRRAGIWERLVAAMAEEGDEDASDGHPRAREAERPHARDCA